MCSFHSLLDMKLQISSRLHSAVGLSDSLASVIGDIAGSLSSPTLEQTSRKFSRGKLGFPNVVPFSSQLLVLTASQLSFTLPLLYTWAPVSLLADSFYSLCWSSSRYSRGSIFTVGFLASLQRCCIFAAGLMSSLAYVINLQLILQSGSTHLVFLPVCLLVQLRQPDWQSHQSHLVPPGPPAAFNCLCVALPALVSTVIRSIKDTFCYFLFSHVPQACDLGFCLQTWNSNRDWCDLNRADSSCGSNKKSLSAPLKA